MRSEHDGVSHSYTHAKAYTCVRQPQALSSLAWRQEIAAVSLSLTRTEKHTHTHTQSRWVLCWWGPNLTQDVRLCMYSPYLHCYCSPEAAVWVWHLPGKDGGKGEGEGTRGLTEQTGRWREWDNSSPFTFSENAFMISLQIHLYVRFSQFVFWSSATFSFILQDATVATERVQQMAAYNICKHNTGKIWKRSISQHVHPRLTRLAAKSVIRVSLRYISLVLVHVGESDLMIMGDNSRTQLCWSRSGFPTITWVISFSYASCCDFAALLRILMKIPS